MSSELSVFETLHGLVGYSGLLDWLVVFFGQYFPYLLFAGVVVFILRGDGWKDRASRFYFLALAVILARGLLTEIIRFFFFRPRPFAVLNFEALIDHANGASLPSGHAAFYFALAFGIFLFNKRWGWFFIFSSLVIGLTRVIAGAHWPLDIVAGLLVALLSVLVVKWALPIRTRQD